MTQIELINTPNIRPGTAFKILAGGVESLHPKTQLKLLAERMRQRIKEATRQSATGIIDFTNFRSSRSEESRRSSTTQMMSPSGQDNYGEYAPLARREMI